MSRKKTQLIASLLVFQQLVVAGHSNDDPSHTDVKLCLTDLVNTEIYKHSFEARKKRLFQKKLYEGISRLITRKNITLCFVYRSAAMFEFTYI